MAKPCPICKKPVGDPTTNRVYPFCSPRCKQIDLGKWVSDEYKIPTDDTGEEPE